MQLPALLSAVSYQVWLFLDAAASLGFTPREETLTETALVELAAGAPGQILVHKATTGEERRQGADFALAIEVRPGLWLSLLVQAKKLDHRHRRFRELHKPGALGQAVDLIRHAHATGAAAIYLFYCSDSIGAIDAHMKAGGCCTGGLKRSICGPPWTQQAPFGCSVVAAEDVVIAILAGVAPDPEPIAEEWAPWECLLCPWSGGPGRPMALRIPPEMDPQAPLREVPWLSYQPPVWAGALIERQRPDDVVDAPHAAYYVVARAHDAEREEPVIRGMQG